MNKGDFIILLIEAAVFLLPIITLFVKLGGYKKIVEDVDSRTKNFPEWKGVMNEKVATLELNDIAQSKTLNDINTNLIAISTKMDLILGNKIKLEDGKNDN